jgi:predicted nucleotidyltransferase
MTRISQVTQNQTLVLLTPNEQAGLTTFVERLHQRYGADLLLAVLYGSKARGDFDNEADLDVLVVVQMPDNDYWQYWNEIVDIAWEIELAHSLVISLIIKSERDYAIMCEHQSLLARNIERDGIELWMTSQNEPTSTPT